MLNNILGKTTGFLAVDGLHYLIKRVSIFFQGLVNLSKNGIDCSSLIQQSYAKIGIKMPRTAKEQAKVGNKKIEGRVRPGDIVYFKFKQKREKWWHTGMITYVDQKKIKFVHASSSRGVVEDTYNDYYKKNTKFFRRVIK